MKPEWANGNVRAECPDCNVPTSFEFRRSGSNEFGAIEVSGPFEHEGRIYARTIYKLLRCAVCERAGVAKVVANSQYAQDSALVWFWPSGLTTAELPQGVPEGIESEFREAEKCMSVEAWRAASALLRSALEKTLKANGYKQKNLYEKSEAAGVDGTITSARRQRAQDLVRTLGNDVLHEDWRPVTQQEAEDAHHYVGRVIEDFYDERPTVETVLIEKKRLEPPNTAIDDSDDVG